MDHVPFPVFHDDELLDLRLFQCGWGRCAPLHSFCPIVRNHYLFYYVISGYGSLESKMKTGFTQRYDLEAGQGFLISPGQMIICKAGQAQPWKYVWLEFDGLHVAEYLQAVGLSAAQPVYHPLSIEQARQVQEFMLYIVGHPGASSLCLIGHLWLFLDALIQTKSTRQESCGIQPMDFYVQEAISYMERNYQRELTVEEIAGVCQLPHGHFSKLFQEKKGVSAAGISDPDAPVQSGRADEEYHNVCRRYICLLRVSQPAPVFQGFQTALRCITPEMAESEQSIPEKLNQMYCLPQRKDPPVFPAFGDPGDNT